MNRTALLSAFARLVASWALLSLVGYFFGHDLISLLIPALTVISESISADFSTILAWSRDDPHMLTVTATSMNPLASVGRSAIGMGSQMTAGTNLEHILVPVVILYAAIAAWPVIKLKERLAGLLLGIPAALVCLALTTPFLLAGKIEMLYQIHGSDTSAPRAEPFFLSWMLFTEGGGRWLLPLLMAIACVRLAQVFSRPKAPDSRHGPLSWDEFENNAD